VTTRSCRSVTPSSAHGSRRPGPDVGHSFGARRLLASGAVVAILATVVGVVIASQAVSILPGEPPSLRPSETGQLQARLSAIGLPALRAEGQVLHTHQHLDLYVDGRPAAVPAGIGIDRTAGVLSPIHTHDSSGIIHVESPIVRDFTLGEFFDVWGVHFDAHCLAGECDANAQVSVFVDGQPLAGDPRSLILAPHLEIVVAMGTQDQLPNPIPATYAFPAGL
jgi:hypothetical protein